MVFWAPFPAVACSGLALPQGPWALRWLPRSPPRTRPFGGRSAPAAGSIGGIGAGNSTRKPGRNASTAQSSGTDQQDNNNGPNSYSYFAVTGNGGGSYGQVTGQGDYDSGGGAGWNGNGMNGVQFPGTEGGRSRANGFLGGNYDNGRNPHVAVGGFGGGGGAADGGGGGGGYTGGNGGRWASLATGGGWNLLRGGQQQPF